MKEWTSSMSKEETMAIIVIQIPLHPGVADDIKRFNGIQWLIDGGFNLTDAVAKFGKEWLNA